MGMRTSVAPAETVSLMVLPVLACRSGAGDWSMTTPASYCSLST